jgi:hypothetical protein
MTATDRPAGQTALELLHSDHQAILALLDRADARVAQALADPARLDTGEPASDDLREELVIEVVRHFVAEEQYLYPLVRDRLPGGAELADTGFANHRACEHAMRDLEDPLADAHHLATALAAVRRLLEEHVAGQHRLFMLLAAEVDRSELVELAGRLLGAEQLAPTRPRAVALENPALNKLSSLVEGFIDHVRDTYERRGATAEDVD